MISDSITAVPVKVGYTFISTLVNVYVDLLVFTRIAGTP